jgi:hypothetical protein
MLAIVWLAYLLAAVQAYGIFRRPHTSTQQHQEQKRQDSDSGVLEVIQAVTPPRTTLEDPACRQTIVEHVFGNSYGTPFVGTYNPPAADCAFTTVVFNLTVASEGRQFDRLALLYLGDVEVWRTSTAMPIRTGIHWSYQKDVAAFHALLSEEQRIVFDLSNVIDGDRYTGSFNVTIEALYFNDAYAAVGPSASFTPAEQIYPISNLTAGENSTAVFSLPGDNGAVNITLPRSVRSAVVSIMASGNGAEEFWWANVPSEYSDTFPSSALGELAGYGPWREVQLLIDGRLAGVSWPFPILFTGGVDPGAWRPIVGIDTYDLPSFEIDVTPWISLLGDGQEHEFRIQVVGYDNFSADKIGTVGSNWWVSGSLFVWLDSNSTVGGYPTTNGAGEIVVSAPPPTFAFYPVLTSETSPNGTVTNTSFSFALTAERHFSVTSTLQRADGLTETVSWDQHIRFRSEQSLTNAALNQSTVMVTSGNHSSSATAGAAYSYQYPLNVFSSYDVSAEGATTHPGSVLCLADRSLLTDGVPLLPFASGLVAGAEQLATRQNVTSMYYWNDTIVEGTGNKNTCEGEAWLSYSGTPASAAGVSVYSRYLKEVNDTMVGDQEGWYDIAVPPTEPLPYVEG